MCIMMCTAVRLNSGSAKVGRLEVQLSADSYGAYWVPICDLGNDGNFASAKVSCFLLNCARSLNSATSVAMLGFVLNLMACLFALAMDEQ